MELDKPPLHKMEQFEKEGYTVLEDFISPETCDALFARLRKYIDELDMSTHPKSVFSTEHQKNDDYFMESQDKVRFFFEENVFDAEGQLNREKNLAVNKMGHGLHVVDEEFRNVTYQGKMQEVARACGFVEPVVIQSMAIFKPPKVGGRVTPHQDGTFLMTKPSKVMGIWIALEDADIENGCLWFIPGSQTQPTNRKMIRNPSPDGPITIFVGGEDVYDDSKFVAVPVKKGSAVVIHGHVVHKSEKNLSDRSRGIYTFHIAETHETEWCEGNWLQPSATYSFPKLYSNS